MILASLLLLSLPTSTISGTVRAEGSHEPIATATVQIVALGRRVQTDEHGYFVIPGVRAGSWKLRAGAPGYRALEREVHIGDAGSVRLDLILSSQAVEIAGVEVRAAGGTLGAEQAGPGATRLDRDVMKLIPAFAEVDVLRAVQTLPAVAAASDFSSALYVRGGSSDQTLVLLDGVPLFNPYHLGGIFAAIDPDAVASVDLLAGAFPARVGDRLSGVVDIQTRDGGRDRVRGSGSVGLISSRATVDGPLPGGRGSYLLSARRTYVDLFTDAAYRLGVISASVPYAFTDAHLKVTHDVGGTGSVAASLYIDDEGIHVPREWDVSEDVQSSWASRAASVRYRQPIGPTMLGEFRMGLSSFGGTFQASHGRPNPGVDPKGDPRQTLNAHTKVRDLIAGADFSWYRRTHQLRTGIQLDSYLFTYDVAVDHEELKEFFPSFSRRDQPWTLAAYAEDEWTPNDAVRLRAGVRVLRASGGRSEWMPRVGARVALSSRLALLAGAGRYAQALYSIKDEESVLSSLMAYDFFAPVPGDIGMGVGQDVVVGAEWESGTSSLRVDAYVKQMQRIPLPPIPSEPLLAPVLVPDGAEPGEGAARGLEVLARHAWKQSALSLSYALASAERQIGDDRFAPRFERRHRLDLMGHAPLGGLGQASLRMLWGTGQPYTAAVSQMPGFKYDPGAGGFTNGTPRIILGDHNSARLPGYFRLDVAVRRSLERRWFGRTTTLTPYLQVFNVLNTRNVLFAEASPAGVRGPQLKFAPQLPILPTFGVEWRF